MLLVLEQYVANNQQSPFVTQYIQCAANGTGGTLVLVFNHAHIMFDFSDTIHLLYFQYATKYED